MKAELTLAMKRLAWIVCGAMALSASGTPSFRAAKPIWPAGRERQMNAHVMFRTEFDRKAGEIPIVRATGCSFYRIRLNGAFVGYGPARAAKSFFRVDEWPLEAARDGRNELTVEACVYNVDTLYLADWPGFLQAEVVQGTNVLAATGADGCFAAYDMPRVVKCSRYSAQRGIGEAYRLSPDWDDWRARPPLPLAEQPAVRLIDRIVPFPDCSVRAMKAAIATTAVMRKDKLDKYVSNRFIDKIGPYRKGYRPEELEVNIWRELQHIAVTSVVPVAEGAAAPFSIAGGNGMMFDNGLNDSGFIRLHVDCQRAGRLWLTFDELLMDGKVNPERINAANGILLELKPGTYDFESFEPYTLRYLHVFTLDGAFRIDLPGFRVFKNADAKRATFRCSDRDIDAIFAAARESFAQNAVDVLSDCPGRERAGWIGDTFFTGRSALLFTGKTEMERLLLQNYLLPEKFDYIPEGALPMISPGEDINGIFIPNWAMWFVIELDEYLKRSGDRAMVDALKPRMTALIAFLKRYRNPDGLLEKLPSWVFIEWSHANKLVQDVNYPSNVMWAEVLDCMDRLYGMPELAAEARVVRDTVRRQAWTGEWFCDNAVRQKDGALKLSGECTETCQYYMFFFGAATPATHPKLWATLLTDFGPQRKKTKKHPKIHFSNAFMGNYLRLELLSRAGYGRQLLDETKGYFKYMADRTGTLWEFDSIWASCNHGFASHAAVFYVKALLGVNAIDYQRKKVFVRPVDDVPLDFCEATLPVADGDIAYGWRREAGRTVLHFNAPAGWQLLSEEGR